MLAELPARGIRIGGVTVAPGEARAVAIPLAPGSRTTSTNGEAGGSAAAGAAGKVRLARQVPAWVIVGAKPGPRVTVVAAPRGLEATAARAAAKLAAEIEPALLGGSLVVVPVLRSGGRLSRRVGPPSSTWRFPGDVGGKRAERDAFALFSNLVVGAQALLILGVPRRGRRGAVVARGELADPRVRRLASQTGAVAVLPSAAKPLGLQAAAAGARVPCVELFAEGGSEDGDAPAALTRAARASLEALGMLARSEGDAATIAPKPVDRAVRVRAPSDGILEALVTPGSFVRAGARLGRLLSLLPGPAVSIAAPVGGLVIEILPSGGVRAGATLFMLVPMSPAVVRVRLSKLGSKQVATEPADAKTRVGWVEHVALPGLGIERLKAKIDTGARTSALHVARIRTVDTTGGPHRRPILEITVPAGGRGRRPHRVRAAVRGFTVVRDTSGRTERRPVIETALALGPIKRRIAVTLTNRGDMLFPMLIGRTALGPGIVVDPARRYVLDRSTAGPWEGPARPAKGSAGRSPSAPTRSTSE